MSQYNLRSPAVKRLMREAEELRSPTREYHARPLEDNLFEWHFTLSGPPNTDFEGGVYHGRITLPTDYPMKPPSIILLTPNGRFETNKKICLSISGYHPESWQPSWSIRTALLALIGFLPTHGNGAIGSLDYTSEERKELAIRSQNWKCPQCGLVKQYLATNENEMPCINSPISSASDESEKEEKSVLSSESPKLTTSEKSVKAETVKYDSQSPENDSNFEATSSTPSTPTANETLLRHRVPESSVQHSQRTVDSNASQISSRNWSLIVMKVIVIILCLLILRRIICL